MHSDRLQTLRALEERIIELRVCRLELILFGKANFNPSQPRVPAGKPDGGQWTKLPASSQEIPTDAIEEVYPEELLTRIPAGAVRNTWRAWRDFTKWRLSRYKSPVKWGNQITKRGWTPEEIEETVAKGKEFPALNKRTKGPATRYEYRGRFVVRDDKTKEILQISGDYFEPSQP